MRKVYTLKKQRFLKKNYCEAFEIYFVKFSEFWYSGFVLHFPTYLKLSSHPINDSVFGQVIHTAEVLFRTFMIAKL